LERFKITFLILYYSQAGRIVSVSTQTIDIMTELTLIISERSLC